MLTDPTLPREAPGRIRIEAVGVARRPAGVAPLALWAAVSAGALSPHGVEAQILSGGQLSAGPEVAAAVLEDPVEPGEDGSAAFTVMVRVPDGHHGYLDEGDDGYYFPFELSFPTLPPEAVDLTLLAAPEGVRDEEAGASVLRGEGRFRYRIRSGPAAVLPGLLPASFRYQICDEATRVCYPPRTIEIQVRVEGKGGP